MSTRRVNYLVCSTYVWGCIGEVYYASVDSPRDYCVVLS